MNGLLTPQQAADYLAISTRQLRSLTVGGLIRYVNVGRGTAREARRYDLADIKEYIEAGKCQYTNVTTAKPTHTISSIVVEDIQEIRKRLRSAKQNASRKNFVPSSKPSAPTHRSR